MEKNEGEVRSGVEVDFRGGGQSSGHNISV